MVEVNYMHQNGLLYVTKKKKAMKAYKPLFYISNIYQGWDTSNHGSEWEHMVEDTG